MKTARKAAVPKHEHKLSVKKSAIVLGSFVALIHLIWSLIVASGLAQGLADWKLSMHFISMQFTILPFDAVTAITLIVASFIGGLVIGAVFATIWNNVSE